jgi:gamma-glutamyl-gamma-aminobutyrate hydrolase PuuD
MRIDTQEYAECRDTIDRRWYNFLDACSLCPILLPNTTSSLSILKNFNLSGIIFTGGNSLEKYGGDAFERDTLEQELLTYSINEKLPILGVCRGMQVIQDFFGITLQKTPNHVATRHNIIFNGKACNVNSFHEYGTMDSTNVLLTDAITVDGVIKAISHPSLPIRAIMWHPEREEYFSDFDISLFKQHFSNEK